MQSNVLTTANQPAQAQESWHRSILQAKIPGMFKGSTDHVFKVAMPSLIEIDGCASCVREYSPTPSCGLSCGLCAQAADAHSLAVRRAGASARHAGEGEVVRRARGHAHHEGLRLRAPRLHGGRPRVQMVCVAQGQPGQVQEAHRPTHGHVRGDRPRCAALHRRPAAQACVHAL